MRHIFAGTAAALTVAAATSATGADQVMLPASLDNTLYQSELGDLSNGIGEFLFAGKTDGAELRRGLIAFDVAGAVPMGSTITSVSLRLTMSKTISDEEPISLHRVLAPWGEGASDAEKEEGKGAPPMPGDATWLHTFFDQSLWQTTGGDFSPAPSATLGVADVGEYTWVSTPELVSDAQRWLDDPAGNFGWLALGNEGELGTAKRFNTRENADEATRPVLIVEFTPPDCYADCDANADLDLFDFLCFVNAYNDASPGADCDLDGVYSLFDFLCFVNAFNSGC